MALVREIGALCGDLGHEVIEADPDIERDAVVPTFLTIAAANSAVESGRHPTAGRHLGGEVENVTFDTAARAGAGHGPRVRPGHADRPPPWPADGGLPSEHDVLLDPGAGDASRRVNSPGST